MATNSKKYSLFFLLFTLSASLLQLLHARESQFFSKFSNHIQPQEKEPNFIPQFQESTAGYGLSGHLPPSTTSPAATSGGSVDNLPTTFPENYNTVSYTTPVHTQDSFVYTGPQHGTKNQFNNGRYYHNNGESMYSSEKQGMGDTRVLDDKRYYHDSDTYNSAKQGMGDTRVFDDKRYYTYNSQKEHEMDGWDRSGNTYDAKRQGMSDTRFMENGKYYYDLNRENEGVNLRGRNGHNGGEYFGNNVDSFDRYYTDEVFEKNQEDGFTP